MKAYNTSVHNSKSNFLRNMPYKFTFQTFNRQEDFYYKVRAMIAHRAHIEAVH